ncbi:rRNA maturation RNase YbeY [Longibacter salinarum]|uniref:Endoribonuclease YbeY n=1 Tax=Longibacter salinarum TaxID=1850348 RepID=A0A2A8D0G9_9BACT|nr:rRNA maturation RNase YbeY [Longibacter salinarum]PEN14370.1 rRNA maturation RNase YbeY [Longibacter salinarum]
MSDAPSYAEPVSIVVDHDDRTVDTESLTDLVHAVVNGEGKSIRHVSIVCADHQTVRRLNREYLDHDYNTDVLSFSLADPAESALEGEVYIDLDTAAERHEEFGSTYETEVGRYVAHGVLHLAGYDDATDEEKQRMHELEDLYLRQAGWSPESDGRS